MRKFARYLALFLVLALLGGVFAIAAFADEPEAQAETTVGAYDEAAANVPEKFRSANIKATLGAAYTVNFATWVSEDAFLAGADPLGWYTTDADAKTAGSANYTPGLSDSTIGYTAPKEVGYVHLYTDVENNNSAGRLATPGVNNGKLQDYNSTQLVINLAGHTLTDTKGWTVNQGSASYTDSWYVVKNGTLIRKGGFYCRADGVVIYKNVVYDCTQGNLSELTADASCELFMFEDCEITLKANQYFTLGGNRTAPCQSYLVFKNTHLKQAGTPTTPLFNFSTSIYDYGRWYVIFDKDCVVERNSADWAIMKEGVTTSTRTIEVDGKEVKEEHQWSYRTFRHTYGIYFELGCELSAAAAPNYEMQYSYNYYSNNSELTTLKKDNGQSALPLTKSTQTVNTAGQYLEIAVVKPSATGIGYTMPVIDDKGNLVSIMTLTGTSIYDPSITNTNTITGTFNAEKFANKVASGEYIAADKFVAVENSKGLLTLVEFDGEGYVVYDDANDSYIKVDTLAGYNLVKFGDEEYFVAKAWTGTTVAGEDFDLDTLVCIDPATGDVVTDGYWYLYNADGSYTLLRTLEGLTDITVEGKIVYKSWQPDSNYSGILYAVWENEHDYKTGVAPKAWYQNADSTAGNYTTVLLNSHIGTDSNGTVYGVTGYIPGFVRLYQDVEILKANGQMVTGQTQKLIIDLGGKKLTMNQGIRVGGSSASHPDASLELRNGTVDYYNGQLQPRQDTALKFVDLTWNINISNFIYDSGCASIDFIGSTINLNASDAYMMLQLDTAKGVKKINFIDTDIIATKKRSYPVMQFTYGFNKDVVEYAEVFFDKDSSVNVPGIAPFFQTNRATSTDGNGNYGEFKTPSIINFEMGFSATANVFSGKFYETFINHSNHKYDLNNLNNYQYVTGDDDTRLKFNIVDGSETVTDWYAVGDGSGMVTLTDSFDATPYKIIEWGRAFGTTEERIANRTWTEAVFDEGNAGMIDGATLKFYDNAEIKSMSTFYDYDYTLDFNSFKVAYTNPNSLQFGMGDNSALTSNLSGAALARKIVIKNGSFEILSTWTPLQARPGTELYFEDLEIVAMQHILNDGGTTVVSFKNCVLKSNSGGNVASRAIGVADVDSEYIFDNTKLNNLKLLNFGGARANDVVVTVKNGTVFDNSQVMLSMVNNTTTGAAETPVKTVVLNISMDTVFTESYSMSKTSVSDSNNYLTVNYVDLNGETVDVSDYAMYFAGNVEHELLGKVDGFKLAPRPTVGNALLVNLTLATNFDVNFYGNEKVEGILYNGKALESAERTIQGTARDMYSVALPAHLAADDFTVIVLYSDGDKTFYLPLNYSVLTYAEKLMAEEGYDDAKTLAKSAIAYVKEAYKVANAEVAEYQLPEALRNFNSDVTPATAEGTLPEALTAAVASVQFKLESSVNLVIKIAGDYAGGTIKVNGVSYEAAAGSTVIVPLRAKALAGDITVTAGDDSAIFTLAGYVNSEAVQGSNMEALVEALYTYASYAKTYATNHPNLD